MKPFVLIAGEHAVEQTRLLILLGEEIQQVVRPELAGENSRIFLLWQMAMENESDHLRRLGETIKEAPLK